jgi:hypothetical protein
MSGKADDGGADGFGGRHKPRDDPWMTTVTNVAGFLAGFSLATVVLIASAPGSFLWPGVAVLALTIASVVLVGAAQWSRNGAYYYEEYRQHWRDMIWFLYHVGVIALLAGVGAALVPKPDAGQPGLRQAAACIAFVAAFAELTFTFRTPVKRRKERTKKRNGNYDKLTALLLDRRSRHPAEPWHSVGQGRKRFWCCGANGEAWLVIAPEADGFLLYRADQDQSKVVPGIKSVRKWLLADEAKNAAALPVKCEEALAQARKQQRKARRTARMRRLWPFRLFYGG